MASRMLGPGGRGALARARELARLPRPRRHLRPRRAASLNEGGRSMFGYSEDQIAWFGSHLRRGDGLHAVHGVHHPAARARIEAGKFGTLQSAAARAGRGPDRLRGQGPGFFLSGIVEVSAQALRHAWYDDALAFVTGTLFITIGVSMFTTPGFHRRHGGAGLPCALRHRHRLRAAVLRDQPALLCARLARHGPSLHAFQRPSPR